MKREEKIAETYFKYHGFHNIIFEPKGNRTPDFEINNKIAVEVRRLNQFHKGEPIEKVEYNLVPKIITQIKSYGNGLHKTSAFIGIKYSRPINYNKRIKEKINSILDSHSREMSAHKTYKVTTNLEINIFPSQKRFNTQFHFGSSLDSNQGGFILNNIYNSLKIRIKEKTIRIQPFKSEYRTWWLALIDDIGNGLTEYEIDQLKEIIDFDLNFDKVFIISNLNPTIGGEL